MCVACMCEHVTTLRHPPRAPWTASADVLPDGSKVQMFSALCALLIQSVAKMPPMRIEEMDEPEAPVNPPSGGKSKGKGKAKAVPEPSPTKPAEAEAEHPHVEVVRLASGMLQVLVSRCLARLDDAENKALLEEFVRDNLLLVGKPEWPGASPSLAHPCLVS